MNPDTEDRKIKALFQELRQVDARQAPPFSAVRRSRSDPGKRSARLMLIRVGAALTIGAIIVAGIVYLASRGSLPPQEQHEIITNRDQDPDAAAGPRKVENEPATPPKTVLTPGDTPRRVAHRSGRRQETRLLISEWKSPTDSLLRIPGEEWLGLPRLAEPVMELPLLPRDRKN